MMFEIMDNIRIGDIVKIGKRRFKIIKILSEKINNNEKTFIVDTKEIIL